MAQYSPPICWACKHFYDRDSRACKAFPDGIPEAIYFEAKRHDVPVSGDGGVIFALLDTPEARRHLKLFYPQ